MIGTPNCVGTKGRDTLIPKLIYLNIKTPIIYRSENQPGMLERGQTQEVLFQSTSGRKKLERELVHAALYALDWEHEVAQTNRHGY